MRTCNCEQAQELRKHIQELEAENAALRQDLTKSLANHTADINAAALPDGD